MAGRDSQEEKSDHSWPLLPYNVGQRIPTSREHFKQLYQPLLRTKTILTKYSGRLRPTYIPDYRKQKAYEVNIYLHYRYQVYFLEEAHFQGRHSFAIQRACQINLYIQ